MSKLTKAQIKNINNKIVRLVLEGGDLNEVLMNYEEEHHNIIMKKWDNVSIVFFEDVERLKYSKFKKEIAKIEFDLLKEKGAISKYEIDYKAIYLNGSKSFSGCRYYKLNTIENPLIDLEIERQHKDNNI